jgi:TRAP-type mannitol/chloroaromatic compound transport system substrate-binding protein
MFCEFGGGVQLVQEMHNKYFPGVHVVLCGPYSREALVASRPIRKVEDLKGVKIRAPEGLAAEVFRRAGATPVTLPPSEVYTSLEKKIIDAADMSAYENNDSSGLHKIAKFPIYPGIHSQPVQHLAFNQKVWDSLTPAQRTMLEVWGHAMLVSMTRFADMQDRRVVARDKAGQGVPGIEIINWPQEERDKLRQIAEGAWKDFAKRGPFAQKVYEVHVAFFKRMGML